jgi:hypothetical protein
MSRQLSPSEIYQLAVKHGFAPGQEATLATAIAMQESQGRTDAFNPKDTAGGSVGLMQINGANAGLIGGNNWKSVGTDPDASMAAAHALYARRGNFTDWGGFTDGGYKKYYNQALSAANSAPPPGTTTLNSLPAHPHTLTPPTAGDPYTSAAVNAANPPAAAAAPPAPELNSVQKFFTRPEATKDAEGNEVQGKSPIEKLAGNLGGAAKGGQQAAAPTPATFAPVPDPMAAMAGPAAQLYTTVQQAAAKPLSWSSRPYGWNAGLQMTAPGMSLNTTGYG